MLFSHVNDIINHIRNSSRSLKVLLNTQSIKAIENIVYLVKYSSRRKKEGAIHLEKRGA